MPIIDETVTPTQFDFLQQNITDQSNQFTDAGVLAQSGLEFVVLLQTVAPEVDLVDPFANHLVNIEGFDSSSNFVSVVSSLNSHAVQRGTTQTGSETLSDRLNRYLSDNSILVTQIYADLSSGAGFAIDSANVDP